MVICPNCKDKINKLAACVDGKRFFELVGDRPGYSEPFEFSCTVTQYECPNCGYEITQSEDEAIKILKGV